MRTPFFHILDHRLRLRNGPKLANFGPNVHFWSIKGLKGSRWLAKVEKRVDHSETYVGGLP